MPHCLLELQQHCFPVTIGWCELVIPVEFDESIHKLTDIAFDEPSDTFIHNYRDLTQTELDNAVEAQEDNEAHVKLSESIENGVALIHKASRRIDRKEKKGDLSENQADKVRRAFIEAYKNLHFRLWKFAKEDLEQTPLAVLNRYNSFDNLTSAISDHIEGKIYRVKDGEDIKYYEFKGVLPILTDSYEELNNSKSKQAFEVDWLQRQIETQIEETTQTRTSKK